MNDHTASYGNTRRIALNHAAHVAGSRLMITFQGSAHDTYQVVNENSGLLARCRKYGHDLGTPVRSIETI